MFVISGTVFAYVNVNSLLIGERANQEGKRTMNLQEVVETTSRVKTWYLTTFKGHKVHAIRYTPYMPLKNHILYSREWVLIPAQSTFAA